MDGHFMAAILSSPKQMRRLAARNANRFAQNCNEAEIGKAKNWGVVCCKATSEAEIGKASQT